MPLNGLSSTEPLRVAFCHYSSDVCGGSDLALFEILQHLPRDRYKPAAIIKIGDPLADEYRAMGLEVFTVPLIHPRNALNCAYQARFALRFWPSVYAIARAVKAFNADLIHVNTAYNLQGGIAARLAGRPLVWHVRELADDSFPGRLVLKTVARLATRAVAISSAVAQTLGACKDRLRVITDAVELDAYKTLPDDSAVRRDLNLDGPAVSCVGRIEPWKGQHVLIEAAPAILEAKPDARILIVGGPAVNKPEYLENLKRRAAELGIAPNVVFTGIRKDIPQVLAASDILVLPSVTPEPFGRTVIEAMAAATPVVATAAGGPLDTVLDGETGFLVPPQDPGPLARKVSWLFDHPEEARAMGQRGRQRAFDHFTMDRVVRELAAVFDGVARTRAR